MIRCFTVVALCVLLAGCGGSPTGPGLNDTVSGTWAGTVNTTTTSQGAIAMRLTLSQDDQRLTGAWASINADSNDGGPAGGTVDGNVVSLSLRSGRVADQCFVNVSATVVESKMTGTYGAVNCPISGGGRLDLTRQ
jgi:hypothetical protein